MKAIENTEDFNSLLAKEKPIFLDFYADWCGPCQTLLPIVESLSEEFKNRIEIRKVDVDQNRELAAHFQVRSIPALFFIKNSEIIDKQTGLISKSKLRKKIEALLN